MTDVAFFEDDSASIYGYNQGEGVIASTVPGGIARADGDPVSVKVQLYSFSGRVLDEIMSNDDGEWEFRGLSPDRLFWVRVRDPSGDLNGAVLDWIQPVPME